MKRTNIFKLNPGKEEEAILRKWADNCSRMFNEINYKRRQSFFSGEFDWNTDEFYHKYKKLIGSATAQQIIIKNNEAWKSFFALLKAYKAGKIEDRPHSPGYWKDRNTSRRILRILVRSDAYKLDNKYLRLPFKLKVKWRGKNRWRGKQGRLEIVYDALSGRWVCYQPVEVEPLHQPIGDKKAYVDLGVKCPIVVNIEGETWGYRANSMLADWWYLTKEIARVQEELEKIGKKSSKKLRKLYRKRKRRFRDSINKEVADFVRKCWEMGVAEMVCGGDLRGIREDAHFGRKANAMIHNFWSVGYQYRRLREKAEEYGIRVRREDERGSSSECPRCGSKRIVKRGRLFKCVDCKLEAHRDAVGSVNIGLAQGERLPAGVINRAVARPLLSEAGTSAL